MHSLEFLGFDGMLGLDFLVRFIVALLCGGALGMERETTGKPAGLRTCILVCVGSMLFTEVGMAMSERMGGDATRIAAQIVTGIGFLGAGVILQSRQGEVRGVTTAAMIWLMAALGMMIGGGYVLTATAVTVASVVMILALKRVEEKIRKRWARDYAFVLRRDPEARKLVTALLNLYDDAVHRVRVVQETSEETLITFRFIGSGFERRELLKSLALISGVLSVRHLSNGNRQQMKESKESGLESKL